MARPVVQLLGSPGVDTHTGRVDFVPERRYQLLAYLAYARDWVARDQLAFLFWPNTSSQAARGNLRSLIERVRELSWATGLESERHRVRWSVDTDVAALESALDGAESGDEGTADVTSLVSLYRGPLLHGMEGYDESEFATWLELERGHLAGRYRATLLGRADRAAAGGATERALEVLDRVLALDRLDEEAVQRYLELGGSRPWRDRARRAFRDFARHLDRELGLAPAERTRILAERLDAGDAEDRPATADTMPGGADTTPATSDSVPEAADATPATADGAPVASPPRRQRRPHLPVPPTSFVGRDVERAEIARLLEDAARRLVTLVGAGGIGKTRLALCAAQDLAERYGGRCWFVRLEAVAAPDLIAAHVAEALDVTAAEGDAPLAAVVEHLADRPALLVLDNLEHLLDGVGVLTELLSRCPGLAIIATSRERLNLAEEWLLPVGGLSYPPEPVDAASAIPFDAVMLFVERARRAVPGWTLGDADAPHVATICRVLDGTPLAIELAAVWVRAMSCAEIVAELRSGLDLLSGAARSAVHRHGSIRATFEYSWSLLGPPEQW